MNIEEIEELEREHGKVLLALEQEIEGWKAANRILKVHLEQAEKSFDEICNLIDDESCGQAWIKSDKALQAIRGN